MVPRITVTRDALEKIERVRKAGGHPDACLRIGIAGRRGGQFAYDVDLIDPRDAPDGDVIVDTPDLRILVDASSADLLDGATIDLAASAVGGALHIDNPNDGWADPIAARVQQVLDRQINPGVAAHGGYVELLEVRDGAAYIQMGGGCQGCAQVDVTLRQGVEVAINAAVPEITQVIDTTDHAAGLNPYFQASKKAS